LTSSLSYWSQIVLTISLTLTHSLTHSLPPTLLSPELTRGSFHSKRFIILFCHLGLQR
jgi:hypothetical protein